MIPERRENHFRSLSPHGFHRVVYDEWGASDNLNVVICVHGVGRNARDFDDLAAALAPTHRVLSVDMPGRGRSDWLADPNDYVFPTYLTVLTALIARSGAEQVGWVGTSMGGLLGMHHGGATELPCRAARRQRCRAYDRACRARAHSRLLRDRPDVCDVRRDREIRAHDLRAVRAADRRAVGASYAFQCPASAPDGRWGMAYDPGIAVPFRAAATPPDLWPVWDAIRCPTLVLRGHESDLLSAATVAQMAARGPRPAVVEFAGVGHAPMLLASDQIDPVVRFLRG